MGYFPNGTEGALWESRNCANCVHDKEGEECPVMLVHGLYNYDQQDNHNLEMVLGSFIPRNGKENQECAMRHVETCNECIVGEQATRDKLGAAVEDWRARAAHENGAALQQTDPKAEGRMLGRSSTYYRCAIDLAVTIDELVGKKVPGG